MVGFEEPVETVQSFSQYSPVKRDFDICNMYIVNFIPFRFEQFRNELSMELVVSTWMHNNA